MAQMRIYRAAAMPGTPKRHALYIIEDDTNVEFHYVDAAGNVTKQTPAAAIAALGSTSNITAVPGSFADEAAVQTYLVTLRADVEARLDALEAKVDAVIAALKTAKLMKTS
jgi:hypothetical protein